jgi:uncharacterized protein YceK
VPYIGPGGVLFGSTVGGGPIVNCNGASGCGTVFSLTPPSEPGGAWTQSLLYSFQGPPDGSKPAVGVLPGPDGTLLGTTIIGGPANSHCRYGCGTLFQLTPPSEPGGAWTEATEYDFDKADSQPYALLAAGNGNYFGVALFGGNKACNLGCGSVLRIAVPGDNERRVEPDTNSPICNEHGSYSYLTSSDGR